MTPLNQCCTCLEDFSSQEIFDRHITSAPSDPNFFCMSVGGEPASSPCGVIFRAMLRPAPGDRGGSAPRPLAR